MATIKQKFIDGVIEMVKLYDKYLETGGNLDPKEFAKSNFCEENLFINKMKEECIRIFFEIYSQRNFLKAICDDVLSQNGPEEIVHIYLLLCFSTTTNVDAMLGSILKYFKQKQRDKIVRYFSKKGVDKIIKDKASEIFEAEDKRDNIVKEFRERAKLLYHLGPLLEKRARQEDLKNMSVTVEDGYRLLSDLNSSKDVTTSEILNQSLTSVVNKDILKTTRLKHSKKGKNVSTSIAPPPTPKSMAIWDNESQTTNFNELNNHDEIPIIKQTVTQVLREQARVKKKAEQAEKVFKDISKGSIDPYKISAMLEELRMEESENQLRAIERKHLLGRISQEEARLSRLAVQKNNQRRAANLKEQKRELELKLAEYRREEEARIKEMAEKGHNTEMVRQAQMNLLNQKKQAAKEIQNESRQIRTLIVQRKQEELDHKINLIRQIKELEQASKMSLNKEPKPSIGIGVSCSMTLQELRDALAKIRAEVQEEVAERRKRVQQEKLRQKALIENAKETIERYKNVPRRSQSTVKLQAELKLTPELVRLRRKLKQRRAQADQLQRSF